jgi:phage terminase small subunit
VLTEKQKSFCREYFSNGGNGTQAYLFAYDSKSETSAAIEASRLLTRDDIREYLDALNKPKEDQAKNEREKKRTWLWDMIENPATSDSDRLRAMDILNKMDSEYININRNIEDKAADIKTLDTSVLEKLARPS